MILSHPFAPAASRLPFVVEQVDLPGTVMLIATGEFDLATASLLDDALSRINPAPAMSIIVDLSAVPFMDCAALGTLLDGSQRARSAGCSFTVANPQRPVRRLFDVTELRHLLAVDAVLLDA